MRELFLVSFGGIRYGIWKDEIQSVRGLDALHRIPLSPACIAGVMMDEGRTVTLADLAACLGHGSSAGEATGQGSILLTAQGGFVASGEIGSRAISPGSIYPLPDFLHTPLFDNCAVVDGIPVPVIAVAQLYACAMQAGGQPPAVAPRMKPAAAQDAAGGIRLFSAAGERYAAPAAGIAAKSFPAGAVTPLPGLPRHVRGVAFHGGRLLPVIDLAQRIGGQDAAPDATLLVASIDGEAYGLLVDRDEGSLPDGQAGIQPAPAIVRNAWLTHVAVHGGEIIPLVDLARALSADVPPGGAAGQDQLSRHYAPASRFDEQFFRRDVAVLEFSLLGERHALPKQEVEDVIAWRPCRSIPGAPPVVIGVAMHGAEILPVLDLAMMFGRRSLATPAWRMLLVSNGDFRALVIAESVYGERRLARASHRAVPLKLPHHLMYGCYPDADAVRLILNAEAIALHFEKSLIQQFLPGLSPQMRMMSAEAVLLHETQPVPEPAPQAAQRIGEAAQQADAAADASAAARPAAEPETIAEPMPEPEAEPEPEPEPAAMATAGAEPPLRSAEEWNAADAVAAPRETFEMAAREISEEMTQQEIEEMPVAAPAAASEVSAQAGPEGYLAGQGHDAASAPAYIEQGFRQRAEVEDAEFVEWDHAPGVAAEPAAQPATEPELSAAGAAMEPEAESLPAETAPPEIELPAAELPAAVLPAMEAALQHAPGRQPANDEDISPAEPPGDRLSRPDMRRRRLAYAAAAAVLLAALSAALLRQPDSGRSAPAVTPEAAPANSDQAAVQPLQPGTEVAAAATAVKQAPAESASLPLATTPLAGKPGALPPAKQAAAAAPGRQPQAADVYVVKDGDTLWDISRRYTGDPYNYPRIGGDNRISDYDLIYPGQRIRLK